MNRIEKKCLLGSAVLHGMVALTVLFSTAFSGRKAEEYVTVVTLVDPSKITLTDDKTSGGSPEVAPVAPAPAPSQPVVQQPFQPPVQTPPTRPPEEQKPVAQPVKPVEPPPAPQRETQRVREPEPEIRVPNPKELRNDVRNELPVKTDTSKKKITLDPVDRSTSKAKAKEAPVKPSIDLANVVKRDTKKIQQDKEAQERADQIAAENTARRQAEQRRSALAKAVQGAGTAVQVGTGGKTTIGLVGGPVGSGALSINYGQAVLAYLDGLWIEPRESASDSAVTIVQVTIAKDGRIISAVISRPSGDRAMDRSVQEVLNKVRGKKFEAFPSDTTDSQRTYPIEFNLKSRRATG